MLYLICTYCLVFVYMIFVVTIKETMKRYYSQVYLDHEDLSEYNLHEDFDDDEVPVIKGRTCRDFTNSFAYSMFIMGRGKIGTLEEREYIVNERHALRYARMNHSILTVDYSLSPDLDLQRKFKYEQCTICLSDFEKGERVRVVPSCKHTFHEACLTEWLQKRFRCPNCNLEISEVVANE